MNRHTYPLVDALRLYSSRLTIAWITLLMLSLSSMAQLSTPIPTDVMRDLDHPSTSSLRQATAPYGLKAISHTMTTDLPRMREEPANGSLRILELPTLEYRHLPETAVWGNWIKTSTGRVAWRGDLLLETSGWNTLYFDNYQLSAGDILLIANEAGVVRGAFTEANNIPSHTLTTAPLYGERLILYYYPAIGTATSIPWRVSGITTALLKNIGEELPDPIGGHKTPEPWYTIQQLSCAEATVRHPEISDIARSEVLIVVRGSSLASGTLINNSRQDGAALVLTAAHCLNGSYKHSQDMEYVRESAEQTVFFFNYFSPTGDPLINGIEEQTLAGAEVVAYNEAHDMCLLRITGVDPNVPEGRCAIPPSYQPYFAGWNAQRDFPHPVIGIHHPQASVRRYNRADEKPTLESYPMPGIPVEWINSHLHVQTWSVGTTAAGSSGSGLFDQKHHLVGALTGGNSYCSTPYDDYYYALSEVFTGYATDECLQPHLAATTEALSLEGLDPFTGDPPVRLSHQLYSLMRDSVAVRREDPTIGGIAVRYDIDTSVQYLGAVIVLGAMQEWTPLTLSIYDDDRGKPGKRIHTQQLQAPTYRLFSNNTESFSGRNMSDAFQAFFPVSLEAPLMLSAGTFYIALEAPEETTLATPLLCSLAQPHQTTYAWHRIESNWHPATLQGTPYLGHYWIDPIVAGQLQEGGASSPIVVDQPRVILAGSHLYILLPDVWVVDTTPVQLSLYSSSGLRILTRGVTSALVQLSLSDLPLEHGVYVLQLTSQQGRYSSKIYYH